MTITDLDPAMAEAKKAKTNAKSAADHAQRSFEEATDAARSTVSDTLHRAEAALRDTLESFRSQSKAYIDTASEKADVAQKYVSERVRERPIAATAASVGVGVLIGLLIAGRGDRR
ncbi:MAG: hypothetical protein JWM33_3764 [Caulobacteraceae bacterium]|nr:hypothetical protein [Caulobacteraceae bacterium]